MMPADSRPVAQLAIGHIIGQVDQWQVLTESGIPLIEPGSDLDRDRARCPAYSVGSLAWPTIGSAVDHVHAFGHPIRNGALHIYAPYTLLRTAIETASQAVWILAPDDQQDRIKNTLKLEYDNARNVAEVSLLLPDKDSATNQRRRDRPKKILAEAKRLGANPHTIAAHLSPKKIVAAAAQWATTNGDRGASANEAIWRGCSGVAHGRREKRSHGAIRSQASKTRSGCGCSCTSAFAAHGVIGLPAYHIFLRVGWRDEPTVSAAIAWRRVAAANAGLTEELERLRYEWTSGLVCPGRPGVRGSRQNPMTMRWPAVFRRTAAMCAGVMQHA